MRAGDVIQARVVRITPFGLCLEAEGWTGLLHITELGHPGVRHPGEVVQEGEGLTVKVIRTFPGEAKFGATRRQ
jgi:small subunit ribosomal protein S1